MKKLILAALIMIPAVSSAEQKPVQLLFTAPWCGPCQAAERANPDAVRVNVDEASPELLKKYDVVRIPKLVKAGGK
jgi:thiol-disulfide isomerase/thioredoxin